MWIKSFIFILFILKITLHQSSSTIHRVFKKKFLQAPSIIETPEVHDIGLWTDFEKCPKGHYIFGLRVQYLPRNSRDNEGLIGIKFLCGLPNTKRTVSSEIGFSKNLENGFWTHNLFCTGPAKGIVVKNVVENSENLVVNVVDKASEKIDEKIYDYSVENIVEDVVQSYADNDTRSEEIIEIENKVEEGFEKVVEKVEDVKNVVENVADKVVEKILNVGLVVGKFVEKVVTGENTVVPDGDVKIVGIVDDVKNAIVDGAEHVAVNVYHEAVQPILDKGLEKGSRELKRAEIDLMGLTNVRLICQDFNETLEPKIEFQPGEWSYPLLCNPERQALCGVSVQEGVEFMSGELSGEVNADSVGINRLKMECCEIISPEITCTPWDRWEKIMDFDNSRGLHPAKYSYRKSVGVSKTTSLTKLEIRYQRLHKIPGGGGGGGAGIGFPNVGVLGLIGGLFGAILSVGETTGFVWSTAASETWDNLKSVEISVNIDPGYRTTLYQVVGYCGDYVVRPDWIYQNGTFVESKKRGVIDSRGQRRLRFNWKIAFAVISSFLSTVHVYIA